MGCTDRGSNYNALTYKEDEGRWLAGLSWDRVSVEALNKDRVIEQIGSRFPDDSLENWDFVQLESGRWKATRKELLQG